MEESQIRKLNRRNPGSLCECNCGAYASPGKRFILGHHPAWNLGLTKETDERVAKYAQKSIGNKNFLGHIHSPETLIKMSVSMTGIKKSDTTNIKAAAKKRMSIPENNPMYGKKAWNNGFTKETDERVAKHSEMMLDKWQDKEYKNKMSVLQKEIHNTLERKKIQSIISIKNWQNLEFIEKQRIARDLKPNKTESYIIYLLNLLFPEEWRYTGDFTFWINHKNPDFVNCNGQKKCIEFNGDYYHQNDIPGEREKIFAEFGYDTLILSDIDMINEEKLKMKLIEFHNRLNPYSVHGEI